MSAMNVDNWNAWLDELSTTTKKQHRGRLAAALAFDSEPAFCCLGLGCEVAGIERHTLKHSDLVGDIEILYGEQQSKTSSPEFIEWLGLPVLVQGDIMIDWPADLHDRTDTVYSRSVPSAIHLNDTMHLSFSQIADVLRYFGPKQ